MSVHKAACNAGAATGHALSDPFLVCLNVLLLRDGRRCEDCIGKVAWRGVAHACRKGSRAPSATLLGMQLSARRVLGDVSAYVAMTQYEKWMFVRGGLPAERIHVKPIFVADPLAAGASQQPGSGALYLGQLFPVKGIELHGDPWRRLRKAVPLPFVGDGPLRPWIEEQATSLPIRVLGEMPYEDALREICKAAFLVMAPIAQEMFGRVIIEAFACDRPVIGTRLGSIVEVIDDGRTDWLFALADPEDLARAVEQAASNPVVCARRGIEARGSMSAFTLPR